MAKRTVKKGDDGFFHVSGEAETKYYVEKETAERVARQLDAADAEEAKAKGTAPAKDEDSVED